jgi:hypothetical protein
MRRLARWTLAVSLAVAGALTTGGCDSAPDPVAALTGAHAALRQAGTATIHFNVLLTNTLRREEIRWQGTTQARYSDPTVSATEFSTFTVTTRETKTLTLSEVTVGPVRYHRSPSLITPEGKPWVQLEAGHHLAYSGQAADPDFGLIDPEAYLKVLETMNEGAAILAKTDKQDTIDGVKVRGYNVSCAFETKTCPQDLGQIRTYFEGENQITTMMFWLDDNGRPRRIAGTVELSTKGGTDYTVIYKAMVSIDITGLGGPVTATEPPADQVTTTVKFAT